MLTGEAYDHYRSGKPYVQCSGGGIVTIPRLALVKEADKQYAETGEVEEAQPEAIGSPMIPEDQYGAMVNRGL